MSLTLVGFAHGSCTSPKLWNEGSVKSLCNGGAPVFGAQNRSRVLVGQRQQSNLGTLTAAAGASNVTPTSVPAPEAGERPGTLLEALEHLRRTREDGEELPKEYAVRAADRPAIQHDEWCEKTEVPVIDLSRVETDRAGVAKELHDAATEFGFFQIVNHGLSLETLQEVEAQGFTFFELPPEIKGKAGEKGPQGRAYIGDNTAEKGSSLHWAESLMVNMDALDRTISLVWPDGNPKFSDAAMKFRTASEIINKQLLELLAESLGFTADFFSQHLNSNRTLALRWNFYPACPRPSDVLGASSHTDGCAITVLQQSGIGGLQIQKDGEWIGIKPVEGALVVNIGDTLHAWTNGIFKSVLHRTVVNKSVHRLSLAAFLNVDKTLSISAPEELIDASHPRLYRPFNTGDYAMKILSSRYKDESEALSKDGLLVLEEFKLNK